MKQWLKWRSIALSCVVILGGGATYLHAQSGYPPPAKTPEEAGEKFAQLLGLGSSADVIAYPPLGYMRSSREDNGLSSLISKRNSEVLPGGLLRLIEFLAAQQRLPQYSGRTVSNDGQSAVVEVSPTTTSKPLPLVVIAEDGGWRVDVIATYAKLTGLQGEALTDSLLSVTGTIPKGFPASPNTTRAQCQSNMKQIMLGIVQYAQDYDECLPPARKWTDVLQPYVKSRAIFNCPALPVGKQHGYAYNQFLSQFPQNKISDISSLVNIYETSNLSANAFGTGTGRAYRHSDGANYGYADGHIKWVARGKGAALKFKP